MRLLLFFIPIILFFGCTKVGPDYKKDEIISYPKNFTQDTNTTYKELASWWKSFRDPTLEVLIQKGYENNLDIKQAGLRILQARTLLGVSQGFVYPQLQTLQGGFITTQKNSYNFNTAQLSFDLGWEIDFWGKYARGIESATANLYLSVASYNDILRTLSAEIARNYINYRMAQERIIYAKRNIAIQKRIVTMTEVQFNSGNVSELDMQQAKTQLYTTKAKLPALKLAKTNALVALATLLALPKEEVLKLITPIQTPKISSYIKTTTQSIELLEQATSFDIIPHTTINTTTKIPITLLKNRPDVEVAEYNAKSASAKIGATKALLYPSFSLFGSIGISSTDLFGNWTKFSDTLSVSAGPGFSWNIFQYGRIKNQIRFEDARFEEAMLQYNKTLLQAIAEVTNAINGYIYLHQQLKENKKALEATTRAFNLSAKQYTDGLVSYQRLLSTIEKLTYTQDMYAQIKGALAIQAVLLYKALGGGWQTQTQEYIDEHTKQRLKDSKIDWGTYLDNTRIEHE